METIDTCDTFEKSQELIQPVEKLDDSFYIVKTEEELAFYVAGILEISDTVFDKGIEFLKQDRSFAILYDIFRQLLLYLKKQGQHAFMFMLEENYVDRIYRDSFYFYFSGKHFCYDRFCKRIFLFATTFEDALLDIPKEELQSSFVGSIVIRPILERAIGRTLLDPRYFNMGEPCYVRTAKYKMTAFGKQLTVRAFPYSMQDGETTSCAEITILNLLDYYSQSYPEYHYLLPSDIKRIAKENGYERNIPTRGLKYEVISKIFYESGFYPRLYSLDKMSADKFRRILYSFIESGLPVCLGVTTGIQRKHSLIVIGHGKVNFERQSLLQSVDSAYDKKSDNIVWVCDAVKSIDEFCIIDDLQRPYTLAKCGYSDTGKFRLGDYSVEHMIVPLSKKMYLEASDAIEIFKVIIASEEYGIKYMGPEYIQDGGSLLGTKENPLAVRIFMASSRSLRKCRDEQFADGNEEARAWYSTTVFPKFVWVCELSTAEMYSKKVIGEIILDATASADAYADSLIIAFYPKCIFCRLPKDAKNTESNMDMEVCHEIKVWQPFIPYNNNLYSFHEGA